MLIWDGLKNLVSSLGTSKDKASATLWQANIRSYEDFEQLYRSSAFARKIVDIPTGDMLRRWRGWSADDDFVTGIEAQEKRRQVRKVIGAAHRFARCFGSSAIIINTRSGTLADPLIAAKMPAGDLVSLRVDVYPRLRIESWDVNTGSPSFGEPLTYLWQPVVRGFSGASVRVHASRVIPFSGVPLTPFHANRLSEWGESVFLSLEETLNTAGTTTSVIHSMLHEAKKDIITTDLSGIGTPEGEERVKTRFALGNYLKSVNNMLLLGSEETYQQMTLNFAGLPDIHIRMMQELAGAADIPATRLLSQAPAGMQSTGESDLRNYYDALSAKQEDELREPIERLDALIEADDGLTRDPNAFWYFHPLWQETSTQKAENAWKRAQGTKLIVETGLIPAPVMQKALISQLVEAGDYPQLDAAWDEFETSPYEQVGAPDEPVATPIVPDPAANAGPRLRLVGDTKPRSLYLSRKVQNQAEILAWARGQGIQNLIAPGDLHVTIAYSRAPIDWFSVGTEQARIVVPRGGPRAIETFNGGAVVLLFADWSLAWRWESLCDAGASWDHDGYQPYISLSLSPQEIDLARVTPYRGRIVLGPEIFAEVDEN